MATVRHHSRIDSPPDAVWDVVSDAGAISTWFPLIEESRVSDGLRHCTMQGGAELDEEIVTSDDDLRRFQYRIMPGSMPLEHHLATVDVLDDGGGSLVIYSTDVTPGEAADQMDGMLAQALEGLKSYCES